jgi:hypothetical protein
MVVFVIVRCKVASRAPTGFCGSRAWVSLALRLCVLVASDGLAFLWAVRTGAKPSDSNMATVFSKF